MGLMVKCLVCKFCKNRLHKKVQKRDLLFNFSILYYCIRSQGRDYSISKLPQKHASGL